MHEQDPNVNVLLLEVQKRAYEKFGQENSEALNAYVIGFLEGMKHQKEVQENGIV